jgi:hypothetical protein
MTMDRALRLTSGAFSAFGASNWHTSLQCSLVLEVLFAVYVLKPNTVRLYQLVPCYYPLQKTWDKGVCVKFIKPKASGIRLSFV